jgi:hypothetical protein
MNSSTASAAATMDWIQMPSFAGHFSGLARGDRRPTIDAELGRVDEL